MHARETPLQSWWWRLVVAAGSIACALVLTHAFWSVLRYTPFLLGFGAAILTSRLGGRITGFIAVLFGVIGYFVFPPPLPPADLPRLLAGFTIISGAFSWVVARRYEIEADLRTIRAQYLQAQKMEAVGQLAAGIAHDFNNLLVAIGGYAELVMATFDASDARRHDVLEIRKAAERAAILTRQLLAFSRRQVLQPKVLNLNLLVGNVQKLLHRTIGEDIELVLQLNNVDPVRADPTALEHVLLNLALNARDAMPHGGQLRFKTENVVVDEALATQYPPMTPGRYIGLAVADTGSGMTPEVQARIFEPFFTTKAGTKGTGLGMAMVYGVIKQSGGFIWVNSSPGRGSLFTIYLPAVQEPVEAPEDAEPAQPVKGRSETILLAEDDGATRRLAGDVLRQWGYMVLEARDGEEALATARSHPDVIHLLITDVVMPGLGGRPLAVKLTADRPAVRVLYTSGYATDVMLRQGIESGLPFLPKPFLPRDLLRSVRDVLDRPAVDALKP